MGEKKKEKKPVVKHRCPYCGKMTAETYCKACMRDGWNEVNAMFGSTNGWEKREKVKGQRSEVRGSVRDEKRRYDRKNGELIFGVWVDFGKKKRGETLTETSWRGRAVAGRRTATGFGSGC